jgi:formylglycine-generating enzyme required for sulfatase activity
LTASVVIEQAGEERRVSAADLPVVVGGAAADIPVTGAEAAPLAFVGMEEGEPFLQPASPAAGVICNGNLLTTSQWLRSGDQVRVGATLLVVEQAGETTRLKVRSRVTEVDTEPPVIVASQPLPGSGEAVPQPTVRPVEFEPKSIHRSRRSRRAPHPLLILTWLALGLLALVAWYLFTARAVEVRIQPEPDQTTVSGPRWPVEMSGRYLLRPGTYTVDAVKQGYRDLQAEFEVTRAANQVHEFQLEKLPGLLRVVTIPAAGVRVRVDSRDMGVTPLEPMELAPGEYSVIVDSERFEAIQSTVQIEGGGTTAVLKVELTPLWAPVTIDSSPRGAIVRIDGEDFGQTPLTADLLEGGHKLELRLAGYKAYRTSLNVLANQPYSLPVAMLVPADGGLILTSDPDGATVSIDGEFAGQTPLEIELEPGMDHRISVSKSGHDTTSDTIRLASGQTREIHVSLDAQYGEIEIVGEPTDAELFIDGKSQGSVSQTVRLTAVPHELEVRKAGYETFRRSITPRPGFPQALEVKLRSEAQVQEAKRLPVVQGPQGQELRLIDPGRFRMGASRREPGRRANETFREVELTRRFYLASQEVTNAQFREFREEHRSGHVGDKTLDLDEYPVVNVTWNEAARYCNWLSAREGLAPAYGLVDGTMVAVNPMSEGYRLPSEAEWAWAARFAGSGGGRKYPWGSSLPVPEGSGNYADTTAQGVVEAIVAGYEDGFAATAPVDSFEPNAVGIFNMGGNVAEWVHDFYSIYPSGSSEVLRDPLGPVTGDYHVIRGSSWMDSTVTELRLSFRDYGDKARPDVGFRMARYAE